MQTTRLLLVASLTLTLGSLRAEDPPAKEKPSSAGVENSDVKPAAKAAPAGPSGERQRRPVAPRGLFAILDRDQDGKLTRNELAQATRLLARLDKDKDGALSFREILAARTTRQPRRVQPQGARMLLRRLDSDKDGAISQAEARGPVKQQFAELDKNSDGKLVADELKTFRPTPANERRKAQAKQRKEKKEKADRGKRKQRRKDKESGEESQDI